MELSPIRQAKDDDRIPCLVLKDCGLNGEFHRKGQVALCSEGFFLLFKKHLEQLTRLEG